MRLLFACIVAGVGLLASSVTAHADQLYECPGTHAHVWHLDQCEDIKEPFGLPGTGGGGSHCGLLCSVGKILGGLL